MFKDAKLKIKRANQHIQELQGKLAAFLETDFCRLHIEHNPNAGQLVLTFEMTKSVPEDIPTIIGDAIHNLRATLDLVACEIVTTANGTTDYIKFPVRDTRYELIAAMKGGEIQVAGADIIALIQDVIQPYKGGKGESVWVLHGLDITDKHLRLIPTVSVAALTHVTGRLGTAAFTNATFSVGPSGRLQITGMPGPVAFENYGQPAFAVLFGKGQVFEGRPIVPTLHQLAQLIARIVEAIEKAYFARAQGASHTPPTSGSHPPTT